jgi:hypothetical protein
VRNIEPALTFSTTQNEKPAAVRNDAQNVVSLIFFLCAAAAFVVRFAISPQILDRVINYTSDGGALYEKLHFGTYAIFLVATVVLLSRPFFLKTDEVTRFRSLLRFALWLFAVIAYLVILGRSNSSGFLIDTYLVAAAAGLLMLALNEHHRRALGNLVLIMLVASALIAIAEAITKQRLLPYDQLELEFRPIGLADHPLTLGALCATAAGFIPLTRWRTWLKVTAIFILLVGCAASGARFALLTIGAEILLMLVFLPWPQLTRSQARRAKSVVLLIVLVGGSALVAMLFAAGLLNRFGSTLFDENFMARVSIYDVFNYVRLDQVMLGMRADDLTAIVQTELHLPAIESAPVMLVLLLGLPVAILFTVLVAWLIFRLVRGAPLAAWIGTAAFFAATLSNNTLSAKTPVVTILLVLLIAFAVPRSREQMRPAS